MRFPLYHPDNPTIRIGYFQVDDLPGCSQIGVSHSLFIIPFYRGQGLAEHAMGQRLKKFRELGYDMVVATVAESNVAQHRTMMATSWEDLAGFTSSKTGNRVVLYTKGIT